MVQNLYIASYESATGKKSQNNPLTNIASYDKATHMITINTTKSQPTAEIRQTKSIGWAYPTSSDAVLFKLGNVGAYVVSLVRGNHATSVAGFKTLEQARAFADPITVEYDRWSI